MYKDNRLRPFGSILGNQLEKVEKTWEAGGLYDEGWSNIIEHQIAVAAIGYAISNPGSDFSLFAGPTIVKACLIHDAYKRREVEARKASSGNPRILDEMAKKQELFLRVLGWSGDIVRATASVGHTSLGRFYRNLEKVNTLDKIVHLADSLTDNDQFPMLEVRMANLRVRYVKLQAENPDRYGLPKGRTVFGVQEEIAFRLLAEFGDHAGMQPRDFHAKCIADAKAILRR